jgi:hypothetical protein
MVKTTGVLLQKAKSEPVATPLAQPVNADRAVQSTSLDLPLWTHALAIQPKLTINQPGDAYEQEAETVAAQVLRMPEPRLQHACACGGTPDDTGECPACRAKRLGIQRQSTSAEAVAAPPSVHTTLHAPGQPLDAGVRAFLEPRFGYDFSQVRVHTNPQAAESAKAVNAHAYTVGQNVVFGAGQYQPHSSAGQKLLAHELTHVVQQGQGLQRSCSDGACDSCAGGIREMWITVFFRRRATQTTMNALRNHINGAKAVLRNCCIDLKFDFDWRLLGGGSTFNWLDVTNPATGEWHYTNEAQNLGTGNTFAGARGIPMVVFDDVPATGGGVTVSRAFDTAYAGRRYIAIDVSPTNVSCNPIAHELWHIGSRTIGHDPANAPIAACTSNAVTPTYCNAIRDIVAPVGDFPTTTSTPDTAVA